MEAAVVLVERKWGFLEVQMVEAAIAGLVIVGDRRAAGVMEEAELVGGAMEGAGKGRDWSGGLVELVEVYLEGHQKASVVTVASMGAVMLEAGN